MGKDGKPAAYSKDNVPYAPPAVLHISTAPVKAVSYTHLDVYKRQQRTSLRSQRADALVFQHAEFVTDTDKRINRVI